MVIVVTNPNRHFFAALEYSAFYQQWRYFDSIVGTHFSLDLLFPYIFNVQGIYLIIKKHIEGDLISGLVVIIVNVSCKIYCRQHVLCTFWNGIYLFIG